MILCFDFDLIGCKDLANGQNATAVRHFVSQGDKNTLSLPHAAPRGEGGRDTLQPDCEKKGLLLQCTPSATALSRWSVHLDRPAKRPGVTTSRIARGNLRSPLPTPPRSVVPLSAKARTDTQARRTPPMKRDENALPSTSSSDTSSALGTPFPPLRRTAERLPVRPAAFNAFHHVHSPPPFVFFRRRPLRFRTRRCPCGRTCAIFSQNWCTFFQ